MVQQMSIFNRKIQYIEKIQLKTKAHLIERPNGK